MQMTPTAGQGGNTAIESVAVLANLLYVANTGNKRSLDYDSVCKLFKEYQDSRTQRVLAIAESSAAMTRIQALDSLFWKCIAKLLPVLGEEWETNSTSDLISKSEALCFVEYKGQEGTIPWSGWSLDEYHNSPQNDSWRFSQYLRYLAFGSIGWIITRQLVLSSRNYLSFTTLGSLLLYGRSPGINNPTFEFSWAVVPHSVQNSNPWTLWASFAAGINVLAIGVIFAIEGFRAKNLMTLPYT